MTGISTHVLDTARGVPAAEVPVRLERQDTLGQWKIVGSGRTHEDGRCTQLLSENETLSPGTYKLSFDSETYYAAQRLSGMYPIVQVTFSVREGETHLHIPLLLNPYGYTTYRGA